MKLKLIIAALFLLVSQPAYAQNPYLDCAKTAVDPYIDCAGFEGDPNINRSCTSPDGSIDIKCIFTPAQFFSDPSSIVNAFLSNLLLIAGIILFLLVVVAGFQMIQAGSSGDPHAMEKWRTMLMYGVIGFVIILVAGGVIKIIEVVTGINILNPEAVLDP